MITRRVGRWLVVEFPEPYATLSWALWRGGRAQTRLVSWCQVGRRELAPPVDARDFLQRHLERAGLQDSVGMLTSASLDDFTENFKAEEKLEVRTFATAGMTNALRVGDPCREMSAGTVNLLCAVMAPLTEEAQLEALSIAAEARTAAIMDANLPSLQSGLRTTGTGTDCIVMAFASTDIQPLAYAGKHTLLGNLIGRSVFEAVELGITRWKSKQKEEVVR